MPEKTPFAEKPFTVNPTQLSTKGIKGGINKEPYQSIPISQADSLTMKSVESGLKQNIEYDIRIDRFDFKQIDEIVALICDTVCCLYSCLRGKNAPAFSSRKPDPFARKSAGES